MVPVWQVTVAIDAATVVISSAVYRGYVERTYYG